MLKNLLDKGKCALGFHAGDWSYQTGQGCRQIRICSRCKVESTQVVHTWSDWEYAAAESCDRHRNCERCGETEKKVEHIWAAPVYKAEGGCDQVRPCSRCAETQAADRIHVWDRWDYDDPDQCSQHAACSRCGETGAQNRVAHVWGPWERSPFHEAEVRACRRCGEMIFKDCGDVSLQAAHTAYLEVLSHKHNAADYAASIQRNREVLFSPVTSRYFHFAEDQLAGTEERRRAIAQTSADIELCRTRGMDALFPPVKKVASAVSLDVPNPGDDAQLVGHWRSTEILGSGTPYVRAIDTHCILDASGHLQFYTKSASGAGKKEEGRWSSSGNILTLHFDGGNERVFEFVRKGVTLYCPRESRYRLWERVN